jgi:hypothetical protein
MVLVVLEVLLMVLVVLVVLVAEMHLHQTMVWQTHQLPVFMVVVDVVQTTQLQNRQRELVVL